MLSPLVFFVFLPSCTSRPSWSNSLSSFEPPQDDPEACGSSSLTTLSLSMGRTGHHEEHEGHEVWITDRAKNARVTKIVLRSRCTLWLNFFK